jgi:hypothetical protein
VKHYIAGCSCDNCKPAPAREEYLKPLLGRLIPKCECGAKKVRFQGWLCPHSKCSADPEIYYEFFNSVSCLFAEGVEFMTKEEIYRAIKVEWQKVCEKTR